MTKTVEIDKEYRLNAKKAIDKFFNANPELDYWKEEFEYMNENGIEHEIDHVAEKVDPEWRFSLWLESDGNYTYIAIIERA